MTMHSNQQQTMPAGSLAIFRDPRRIRWLAILVGAAACLAIPFLSASDPLVQLAGAIWLGFCANALCALWARAVDRSPIVRIDEHGILDTRLSARLIEWEEIECFYPIDLSRSHVVELQLRYPRRTLAEAAWHLRLGLDWHRQLDLPHVCISLLLLDGTVLDAVAAIHRHAPHLLRKSKTISEQRARLRAA